MKLLVDEMYSPAIAAELRRRGHDVLAVQELPGGPGMVDDALLHRARDDGRALLTENVADFLAVHAAFLEAGDRHCGLIFASNASFPRGRASTVGALVKALGQLLSTSADLDTDILWLP